MNIDLHVHTSKYSICSKIKSEELYIQTKRINVDGIVITEHNSIWDKSERIKLRKHIKDIKIFWGIEISAKSGIHYLVYYDIDNYDLEFYENIDDFTLFSNVQKIGGVVLPAHLFRFKISIDFYNMFKGNIDGLEIKSNNIDYEGMQKTIALANELKVTQIAGSDAHSIDVVGKYYTEFSFTIKNEKDIVLAIRKGKCNPLIKY